jgi:hypothetical protein
LEGILFARGRETDRRKRKQPLKGERGVALVEFALVLPLLMLLLVGMLDFGKAFTMWIDETHLANQAGRFAAVNKNPAPGGTTVDADVTGFEDYMEDDGDTQELRDRFDEAGNGINVCFPNGTGAIGDSVRVDVKATYHFFDFLSGIVPSLSGDKDLTAHSVMRIEVAYDPVFAADSAQACP